MNKLMLALALAAFAGCSKGRHESTTTTQPAYGQSYHAPPARSVTGQAKHDLRAAGNEFSDAWDRFAASTNRNLDTDDYTFERAKNGAVSIGHKAKKVAGRAGGEIEDAAIQTAVKSRLETTNGVRAQGIHVSVDNGVVILKGDVASRHAAGEAIRLALDTRGVDRVVSYLTWPAMEHHHPMK